jgi:hypothetical protein
VPRTVLASLVVLACVAFGCSKRMPVPAPPPDFEVLTVAPTVEPPFVGKRADGPIAWPLWGDWEITRTEREDGKPSSAFRESWHPRKNADPLALVWHDPGRAETFTLHHTDAGDMLTWRRYRGREFHFSIHRQSFGSLVMTDQDGDCYMAVRTEGGK